MIIIYANFVHNSSVGRLVRRTCHFMARRICNCKVKTWNSRNSIPEQQSVGMDSVNNAIAADLWMALLNTGCHRRVSKVSQERFQSATREYPKCHKRVSKVSQECFQSVTRESQAASWNLLLTLFSIRHPLPSASCAALASGFGNIELLIYSRLSFYVGPYLLIAQLFRANGYQTHICTMPTGSKPQQFNYPVAVQGHLITPSAPMTKAK